MKVPLIPTQAISEFGDLRESAAFKDPAQMDQDSTYIPGYSEIRRQNAVETAEYLRGERSFAEVTKVPVRLRWAKSQDRQGIPDSTKPFAHATKGYTNVNGHSVEKGGHNGTEWLKGLPPGCVIGADGTIRRGDVTLMVCSAEAAASNEIAKRARTDAQLGTAESIFAQNLGKAVKGADPEVTRLAQGQGLFEKKKK